MFFFFNDTATTEIYTLSLHDALPILLVPPAPRALSNSDWLIWPSPLASSCENRCFSASDRPIGAVVAEPAEDWLCAASSALMVAGDICEPPPGHGGGGGLPVAGPFPGKSKGFVAPCPKT